MICATRDRFSAGIDLNKSTDFKIIVFSKVEYMDKISVSNLKRSDGMKSRFAPFFCILLEINS